jgi:hypothetical protein
MFFLFQEPAGGPDITSISATSSMSLRVEWKELSRNDANGLITNYRVCYKAKKDSGDICDRQEIVANVRSTTLFGLDKYTFYVIAVQAATSIGYGPLGANMTERTREDSKYCIPFSFFLEYTVLRFCNSRNGLLLAIKNLKKCLMFLGSLPHMDTI